MPVDEALPKTPPWHAGPCHGARFDSTTPAPLSKTPPWHRLPCHGGEFDSGAGRACGPAVLLGARSLETLVQEETLARQRRDGGVHLHHVRADFGDIIQHGLFSINIFSVILLLAGIAATVGAVIQVVQKPGFIKSLLGAAAGILVAASIVVSALWDTVKDFVKYYDFRAKRRGDRLFIRYGLLKKMEYTVPVDKIQALQIHQSLVARICGRYMAEIVNVGMGDEKEERNSFLVLYCTEEKLRQQLELLLPEMAPAVDQKVKRQPGTAWAAWAFPFTVYVLAVLLAAAAGTVLTDGMASSGVRLALAGIWGGAALLILTVAAGMLLEYRTAGISAGDTILKLRRGYFGTHYIAVKYSNIQYADFSQSFLAKRCGIRKGQIHLLAAAGKSSYDIPYFADGLEENIKAGMLGKTV